MKEKLKEKRDILGFLLIAVTLPLLMVGLQQLINNEILNIIFFGIEAAFPTIAGIIILSMKKELKSFLKNSLKIEGLLLAIILPIIISLVTMISSKVLASLNQFHTKKRFQ